MKTLARVPNDVDLSCEGVRREPRSLEQEIYRAAAAALNALVSSKAGLGGVFLQVRCSGRDCCDFWGGQARSAPVERAGQRYAERAGSLSLIAAVNSS
jgi:hypothetical protein